MTQILPLLVKANRRRSGGVPATRSWRTAALACFVAAVVFATVAAASTPLMSWMQGQADLAPPTPVQRETDDGAPAVAPEGAARSRGRAACAGCGFVESVRRLEQVGDLPASYEFIVRLRDGSRRTSSIANAAQWRAGDRIMLIGGPGPSGS